MINIKQQKYLIALILISINTLLSTTFLIYEKYWYVYLFLLALASLINAFSSLLIIGKHIFLVDNKTKNKERELNLILKEERTNKKNYIYVLPCYNESEDELKWTIRSLILQKHISGDQRSILIICDGKVRGRGNIESTDEILIRMFNLSSIASEYHSYTAWDNSQNTIMLHYGNIVENNENIPFILFVKNKNYGKRDSLVLARSFCYKYNLALNNMNILKSDNKLIDSVFIDSIIKKLQHIYKNTPIDYIIGTDADTIFDYNCSYELIKGIEKEDNIFACVGFVEVSPLMNKFSFFVLYQYAEYIFAQCLRRYAQSAITKKVSCLSGCVQIMRIGEETCGEKILSVFNYLPKEEENIFNHIRSYASEDRNHVCHMLSLYPYVKTTQNINAISYTEVPTSINVFISQRRRWCLGANTNDMMLTYLSGINIFERISAFVNVMTFSILPFIFIATIFFIKSIITGPTYLMLYLSIIILIPLSYGYIIIPIFIKRFSFHETLYYCLSFSCFIIFGSLVNLMIYFYSIACMDVFKWGKTRSISSESEIGKNYKWIDSLLKNIEDNCDFNENEIITIKKDTIADDIETNSTRSNSTRSNSTRSNSTIKRDDDTQSFTIKIENSKDDYYFDDIQSIIV